MKTYYQVISADPNISIERKSIDLPKRPHYMELTKIVEPELDGEWMEHVTVYHNNMYTDMFVDEAGALKDLPTNSRASKIYNENLLSHTGISGNGIIYGTAVLFERRVWY